MSGIKERVVHLIEITQNPMAPIHLQELYIACMRVGQMLTVLTDRATATELQNRLLLDFSNEELNELSSKPEFIIALSACLVASIEGFIRQGDKHPLPMG